MTDKTENVPEWAMKRVQELTGEYWQPPIARQHPVSVAFARYIAAHEEAPVDPLLIEAREIVASWHERFPNLGYKPSSYRDGRRDDSPEITQALAALRRGIELAREHSQ